MSWSYNAQGIEGKNAAKGLADARAAYEANIQDYEMTGYAEDQAKQAEAAAVALIESGTVGTTEDYKFNVSLSGRANPDHAPKSGWVNDMVTISVSQAVKA